jgi:LysM domain-containing protein
VDVICRRASARDERGRDQPCAIENDLVHCSRGDTLTDIAQHFGTSIRNLITKNQLAGYAIYAGQILVVK